MSYSVPEKEQTWDCCAAAVGMTGQYRMREKMFAIGDDFWIENEEGTARLQGRWEGAAYP